jgi:hypothetical protein
MEIYMRLHILCAHAQFYEKGIFFMGCEKITKKKRVAKRLVL